MNFIIQEADVDKMTITLPDYGPTVVIERAGVVLAIIPPRGPAVPCPLCRYLHGIEYGCLEREK